MKKVIPEPFGIDEIRFRACFTAPSFRIFVALVIGWALTVGKHTVSQVILTMRLHESKHFASIYRFLGEGQWSADFVSGRLFRILLETLIADGEEILVVIDDTLNKHRGSHICGAGWQHDGSSSNANNRKGYGLCFVVIGLAVRLPEINDRMFCLPYAARLWWPPKAKVKPKRLPYKTKPQLALELVNMTHSSLERDQLLRIVTDLGYCCDVLIKGRPKDVHITGRLKKGAALFALPKQQPIRGRGRPRKKGDRLPTPGSLFQYPKLNWRTATVYCYGKVIKFKFYRFTALWYHSAGEEPLSVILCSDPNRRYADIVLFDTDTASNAAEIIERYGARWSIEITNRETKQLLGAADPQCRTEQSVVRTTMFAYWTYCFVVLWFVRNLPYSKSLASTHGPWYRHKKCFTFSDMLAAARRSHFKVRIYSKAHDINTLEKTNRSRYQRELTRSECAKL